MTRHLRLLTLAAALLYGGFITGTAHAQFEGLDLGSKKKGKKGSTTTKKKGKKGKEKEEETGTMPPPPESSATPSTSPAAGAGAAGKGTEGAKPGDTGVGLDLSGTGEAPPAAKGAAPGKKGDKAAPTMSFEAVDVSGKTADRQKLDAALAQFKGEDYEKAAMAAWEIMQDPKFGDLHQETQYLLAKSLYRMKLYHSSLGVFSKLLAKGPDGKFFKTSLEWLFFISHKTVNESVVLDEIAKYSNFEFPEKFRSEFHYLLARYHFVRGRALDLAERKAEADQSFNEVKRIALQVPKDDPFYPRARYLEALALFRDDNFTAALEALKEVIRLTRNTAGQEPGQAAANKKLREQAFMQLARTHYGHKQNRYAIFYYAKVERGGPAWLESLFEAAWGHYRIGQYEQALGNLITLSSPFFREEYFPEALVLKAVIYYENCRYKESTMILEDFERIYLPVHDQLEQITSRDVDASEYYNVLSDIQHKNKDVRGKGSTDLILERILKLALTDQDLKKTNDSILELENELDVYGARGDTFKYSDLSKQLIEDLKAQRVELVKKAGIMAKSKLEFELGELKKLLANGLRIRFETTTKEKEFLEQMLQAGGQTATVVPYKIRWGVADDELYWPYEGEYWRDELGTYQYTLTKGCINRPTGGGSAGQASASTE
ncbi:MAG TPA: adventurous gliding motility protein GltC [Myxococcales bacterium]|nr:adventurous gliding motility protein GltC [Myxococcales bacterium]